MQTTHITRGEKRQDKRRRARKMGVSGKSFVNAVRNAVIKRKEGVTNATTQS